MDCEFAYLLDLDAGLTEFWDLVEGGQVEVFPLASLGTCAVDVMECARTPLSWRAAVRPHKANSTTCVAFRKGASRLFRMR